MAVRLRLYNKTGEGEGEGGAVDKLNEPIRHSHAAFSTKTQGTSRKKSPLHTCPVVLHRFVDICP